MSVVPSDCPIMTAGMVMVVVGVPPMTMGSSPWLLATITPTAPAAIAFSTLSVKLQKPRSSSAIWPLTPVNGSQPSLTVPGTVPLPTTPSFTSTTSSVMPAVEIAGLHAAARAPKVPTPAGVLTTTSWSGSGADQRYICMRGFWPSRGVAKLALSVPPPSCASALTESLPRPPLPKLSSWKFAAASLNPAMYRRSWITLLR